MSEQIKQDIAYTQTGDTDFTFYVNGKSYIVTPAHINYDNIIEAFRDNDHNLLVKYLNFQNLHDTGDAFISVRQNVVHYNDRPLPTSLSQRWIRMYKAKLPVTALNKFITNLYSNPSKAAVNELDGYLAKNSLPVTTDGHFLAYKIVKQGKDKEDSVDALMAEPFSLPTALVPGDMYDVRTGMIRNNIGDTPSMPRNECDDNRDITCSTGLHFCSMEYLDTSGFGKSGGKNDGDGGYRIIIVKINPRDVVSIPTDYNNQKGRCCDYEVIGYADEADNMDEVIV